MSNNQLSLFNTDTNTITISSLDLVKLINANRDQSQSELLHKNFLTKVVKVLGKELSLKFSSVYKDASGKENPCYKFPKREACLMAMSYSYDLQAKVFDYMTELEQKTLAQKLPANYLEALEALVVSEKEKVLLTSQLEEAKPAIEFKESVQNSANTITVEEFAKLLGTGRNRMFAWLKSQGYLKQDKKPYQNYIDNGYFKLIEKTYKVVETQKVILYTQTLITGKGQIQLQKKFSQKF